MKEILKFERKLRVWKEWIKVIGNDWGVIGIKGVENKALKIKRIIKLNASLN
ncbi:hypothetical protein KVC91_06685 [Helicobacter pylori]|nr:hypothetical protein KVC91_04820 [Helicobacter pylori]WQR71699.1 hypothetical protein KVC91_06685 [Helicobacter pylori]